MIRQTGGLLYKNRNYGIRRQGKGRIPGNCVLGMPGPCEHGVLCRTKVRRDGS